MYGQRLIEHLAPAPPDTHATAAPVIDYVMHSPAIEYSPPGPLVTFVESTVTSHFHHGSRHHW